MRRPAQNGTIARITLRIIAPMQASVSDVAYRSYMCVVCGHVYSEAQGAPEDGIAPGTRWEDIPDTWTCPDCGVGKDDYELIVD